jgi:hypothetical protein
MRATQPAGYESFNTVLSAVALNASAGARTLEITNLKKRFRRIYLFVNYTYSAATSVTLTPTASPDGTNYYGYGSTLVDTGVGAVSGPYVDTKTGTSSWDLVFEYNVSARDSFKCVFSGGGAPGAGDLITVRAVAEIG